MTGSGGGESIPELRPALEAVADPARATEMARYMKDRFPFLGVVAPDRRAVGRDFVVATTTAGPGPVLSAAAALWGEPEREFQYVGVDLLRRIGKRLPGAALGNVRALVVTKSWWDTVDPLSKVVGQIITSQPELAPELDQWITDDDMWVARVAILHQLGWKERADPEVVFAYCDARIDHPDFFIRKAIGWALRDLARTYPEQVWTWVDAHPGLSNLSRREATKHR